jgi:CheY-like chemotaxis protein
MAASRRSIYWAEDDFADQFMIREAARGAQPPAAITFFQNGQELLEALRGGRPEQVVLDIRMPGMGGVETLENLRRDGRYRDLPVVMFSTALLEGEIEACHRFGVQAFVQKPSAYADFEAAVQTILAGTATGVVAAKEGRTLTV